MNDRERQDPMSQAFGRLPRQQASHDFTRGVLAALDQRSSAIPVRYHYRWVWATATSVLLAGLLVIGFGYQRQRAAEQAYQEQVEQLRSRYRELLDEVATVRREAEAPDTRLYLGGDDQLDLMLDLGQHPLVSEGRRDRQDVRPASWEQ